MLYLYITHAASLQIILMQQGTAYNLNTLIAKIKLDRTHNIRLMQDTRVSD